MDHILPAPPDGADGAVSGLDHVTLTVSDLPRAQAFYDAALKSLAMTRVVDYLDPEDEDEAGVEAVGYGAVGASAWLWLVAGSPVTTGSHLALRAVDARAVDMFFAAGRAPAAGATGAPTVGDLPAGVVSAMLVDPDGNVVEAVAHG